MLRNYFKIAWRNLVKYKVYTIINILGLAIGISACLVIYLISSYELSYDKFHPDKERIYRMVSRQQDPGDREPYYPSNISHAAAHIIREEYQGIDQLANFYSYNVSVTVPGNNKKTKLSVEAVEQGKPWDLIITEPQYFLIFKYDWLAGSPSTALNDPFKVVLTESKARSYFGSTPLYQIIGKELIYDDSLHLQVSGIVKDWNKNTDLIFNDFISYSTIGVSFLKDARGFDDPNLADSWGERTYAQTYAKLKKGISAASANGWITNMIKNRRPVRDIRQKFSINFQPLASLHFDTRYSSGFYSRQAHLPTLYALIGIAVFILIIAVINFINLSTSQSIRRAKEIGIRKVLGSYKKDITLQFLIETALVVFFAISLSLLISRTVLKGFQSFIPPGLTPGELIKTHTLLFLLIVTIITSLLAGLYPARVLSSYAPALSLKGQGTRQAHQKHFLRKALIVFQFTISLFFIIATTVIGDQIHYMLNKDLGFNKDAIVNINIDGINPNLHYTTADRDLFAEKARKLAGVSMVSLNYNAVALSWDPSYKIKDMESGNEIALSCRFADENYAPLYGLKIIAGRNLRIPQRDSLTEFLINETCTKQLGFKTPGDAIGHMMGTYSNHPNFVTGPIVGIVGDFYSQSLQKPIGPLFIAATKKEGYIRTVSIKMGSAKNQFNHFKTTLSNIEKIWKEIYPTEKFEYSFFDEDIAGFYDEEQKNSRIMNAAMAIAIFISCMGLFGLASFTAEQRTREIGIRKVLGASVSGIVTLLSKEFLKLVTLSILIASPIAWFFMNKWLLDYTYRIDIGWNVFTMAAVEAILIALATVSFQAIRAAVADPVKSLRAE